MCGIAGIVAVDPSERVDSAVLRLMTDSLARRGPDDSGQIIDGNAGLGMRRLSIIDVAGGHQPISNEDGTLWIVYNGEVVNHESIRADLIRRGHCFRTRSDTETVLHLFEEEGPDCLKQLRGMFAFAIWDTRQRSLFVARDRFGIKPLHYYFDGRLVLFGSEIKALLQHPAVSQRIDWTAVDAFFTYGYVPAPWTVYRDVRKLLPGHYMIANERGVRDVEVLGPGDGTEASRLGSRSRGRVHRAVQGIGRDAHAQRLTTGCVSQRRCGFQPARRDDGEEFGLSHQNIHDRLWR